MYSLPTEVQFDVFKYLNFNQLFSIKQTNLYFSNFINEYENKLARLEFFDISFYTIDSCGSTNVFKPKPEDFNFPVNKQLEEKWQKAIKKSIPLYLQVYGSIQSLVVCLKKVKHNKSSYYIQLPTYPKNLMEMNILRYYLEKLLNCAYNKVGFDYD
uniref:F-box domain-containing protein n=1 Tax=Meloidogyne hapla TaxID=6305 RepID=A0A1I8B4G3_MELHA